MRYTKKEIQCNDIKALLEILLIVLVLYILL
jgi:hypothetical protein